MPTATPSKPTPTIRGLPRALARQLEAYADRLDVDQIRAAYEMAAEAHSGQKRASGEPYVNHAVEVATILASLRLDTATVVAGLVHDAVEDTAVSLPDLRARFGDEIADLVDGLTKIGKVEFRSNTEQRIPFGGDVPGCETPRQDLGPNAPLLRPGRAAMMRRGDQNPTCSTARQSEWRNRLDEERIPPARRLPRPEVRCHGRTSRAGGVARRGHSPPARTRSRGADGVP